MALISGACSCLENKKKQKALQHKDPLLTKIKQTCTLFISNK